jgi:hypothetical protein
MKNKIKFIYRHYLGLRKHKKDVVKLLADKYYHRDLFKAEKFFEDWRLGEFMDIEREFIK